MWHKAIWKGHPMRLELTRVGLRVELANPYTTRGALALGLVGMHSVAAFIWVVKKKFSYSSFGVCLSNVSWRVSHGYCVMISDNWWMRTSHVVKPWLFVFYFFIDLGESFAKTILWLDNTPSKEQYVSQFTALFIHFFFMDIKSSCALELFE